MIDRRLIAATLAVSVGLLSVAAAYGQSAPDAVSARVASLYIDGGKRLYETGDDAGAAQMLKVALEYAPLSSDAHYLLGKIYEPEQTMTGAAISEYRAALAVEQFRRYSAADCAIALAGIYFRTGQYEAARHVLSLVASGSFLQAATFNAAPADVSGRNVPLSMTVDQVKSTLLRGRESPEYYVLLAQIFRAVGQAADANAVIERGRTLFGEDTRLVELADLSPGAVPDLSTSRWLDTHKAKDANFLKFAFDYALALPDGEVRNQALSTYFAEGGNAPLAWALSAGATNSDNAALAGFDQSSGSKYDYRAIRTMDMRLQSSADRTAFEARYKNFTGTLNEDENGDGFFERSYTYTNGALSSLAVDPNQDGTADFLLTFDANGLQSVESRGSSHFIVTFGEYPYVATVTFFRPADAVVPAGAAQPSSGSSKNVADPSDYSQILPAIGDTTFHGRISYDVAGMGLTFPILADRALAYNGHIGVFDAVALETAALDRTLPGKAPSGPGVSAGSAAASATSDRTVQPIDEKMVRVLAQDAGVYPEPPDGTTNRTTSGQAASMPAAPVPQRIVFLDHGQPYIAGIDHNADGAIDEVIEFRNGTPFAGVRDANGDGYFEISELFSGGKLSYIAVDENMNGQPEFFEELSPVPSLAWDLNGDGRIDVKELSTGRGQVIQLISSKMNGLLDTSRSVPRLLFPNQPSSAK